MKKVLKDLGAFFDRLFFIKQIDRWTEENPKKAIVIDIVIVFLLFSEGNLIATIIASVIVYGYLSRTARMVLGHTPSTPVD